MIWFLVSFTVGSGDYDNGRVIDAGVILAGKNYDILTDTITSFLYSECCLILDRPILSNNRIGLLVYFTIGFGD